MDDQPRPVIGRDIKRCEDIDVSVDIYFSDFFGVTEQVVAEWGAFNISLVNDLPLFIDPFNLFNSERPEYRELHDRIIRYVRFLKAKSLRAGISPGLLRSWYYFREVRQNWLGFCRTGNGGSGLGHDFAVALDRNLHTIFSNFGSEEITRSSHLEKLCLVKDGVGRDNISDFTTNLIKDFLCEYTQAFAAKHVRPELRRRFAVPRARFNYETEAWETLVYELPCYREDYVLLSPKDLLTKDDTWINRADLADRLYEVADSIPDQELRAKVNNYLFIVLSEQEKQKDGKQSKEDSSEAAAKVVDQFPEILDYYIKLKEENGRSAREQSERKVGETEQLFIRQVMEFVRDKLVGSDFYRVRGDTYEEAMSRVRYLKHVIEDRDGYRIFYLNGQPIGTEESLQILFLLTWRASLSDVNREVNNGRGPVDFKLSRGARDKSLVEFKLARNSKLKKNLENQVKVYEAANQTRKSIKVILYFTDAEHARVVAVLKDLKLDDDANIVLIDARGDKPSASNV